MKKVIAFLCAVMVSVASFAQIENNDVVYSRPFENVYVELEGGAQSAMIFNENFTNTILPVAGLEIGKDLTPVVGISLEGLVAFNTDSHLALINNTNLVGNFKVNLMNLFGGYKGYPRRFEILLVPGVGWGHLFDEDRVDANFATYNTFAQFNFNLGEKRAWVLNFKPGVVWNSYNNADNFKAANSNLRATIGIAYRFNNKRTGSHNFVYNPYSVTKADYEAALADLERAKNRPAEQVEVVKEVPVEKVVEKTVEVTRPTGAIITFAIGKDKLTAVEAAKVEALASQLIDTPVLVIGSADTKTGSLARNNKLAENRANVVAEALRTAGVKDVKTTTQLDANANADIARAAIITVQ